MTAAYAPEAYVFGSPENHDLLEAESNELLHFGHRFPAPNGGSTWLEEAPGDEEHGLAVNTSAVLATVTDKQEYKDWYATFWRYIDEYLIDHEHGSWFHQLDKDNHVIGTVWPGKSDLYHALQCTFIPRLNPAVSVAPALKQATETR